MTSRRPFVTIIVNNHNYARFLGAAIESALDQTYPNTEIVVVDDGSSDDSPSVIARYGPRVVPVFKANGGQESALNAGFAVSRGDVVCFLDADDTLAPGALERAISCFEDPRVVKVHWPLRAIDDHGRPLPHLVPAAELPAGDLRDVVATRGPVVT
jgi:glycosyltransferase involved in cell wall biosynthesis